MPKYLPGISTSVLIWARETAGLSVEAVAAALKKDPQVVKNWETGAELLTYPQLEDLAYRIYKRPLAIFFFPGPPQESDPKQSFRTLPESEIDKLQFDTRYAIREAEVMQLALYDLNDRRNPSERPIFRVTRLDPNSDVVRQAAEVRALLGIDLRTQMAWRSPAIAFEQWRSTLEMSGIFVFMKSFKQTEISGFCLYDNEFPIIYVNNSTSDTRQVFTLFHELAHILLGINGITNERYIRSLIQDERTIEIFCNSFASEFLVPSIDFVPRLNVNGPIIGHVRDLSTLYKVSREVILRKLRDRKLVSQQDYEELSNAWNAEFLQDKVRQKEAGGGGDFYATRMKYYGERFLDLAFNKVRRGQYSHEQLASSLNMRVPTLLALEENFLRKVARSAVRL